MRWEKTGPDTWASGPYRINRYTRSGLGGVTYHVTHTEYDLLQVFSLLSKARLWCEINSKGVLQ